LESWHTDHGGLRFIGDTKEGDDILVLRLADEFGEDTDVCERSLSIGNTHDAIEHVNRAKTTLRRSTDQLAYELGLDAEEDILSGSIRFENQEGHLKPEICKGPRFQAWRIRLTEIKVNAQTVFACPLDSFQEISKGNERSETERGTCVLNRAYFQQTPSKNGSSSRTSIAQYGIGMRSQFRPAPAIAAKSCSVWFAMGQVSNQGATRLGKTHYESLVMGF